MDNGIKFSQMKKIMEVMVVEMVTVKVGSECLLLGMEIIKHQEGEILLLKIETIKI